MPDDGGTGCETSPEIGALYCNRVEGHVGEHYAHPGPVSELCGKLIRSSPDEPHGGSETPQRPWWALVTIEEETLLLAHLQSVADSAARVVRSKIHRSPAGRRNGIDSSSFLLATEDWDELESEIEAWETYFDALKEKHG